MGELTLVALDLGYLRTGYAVLRGEEVLRHGMVDCDVKRSGKVTDMVRLRRSKAAYDGLRLMLYHSDQDYGLDALVYEEPQWIGGKMKGGGTSKDAVLALGMALERLYMTLNLVGWTQVVGDGAFMKFRTRPVYRMDPNRWQPLLTGVQARQLKVGDMKGLVRRQVKLRTGIELTHEEQDAADAIGMGLVAASLLRQGMLEVS